MSLRRPAVPALVVAATLTALPAAALACGGCFSAVPPPPPGQQNTQYVVQDAERVVFLRDPLTKQSTVWVEVRYSGNPTDFGWVLPLPKQPTVGVGTRLLLDALDQRMAPRFETSLVTPDENCRDPWDGCANLQPVPSPGADAGSFPSDGAMGGGDTDGEPGVKVLDQGQAGPYDYTVIKGLDAQPVLVWLNKRGYKTPPTALPILKSHVEKGDVFVALKLQNGKGIDAIRPVVLTMDDAEPCVPLRLTSIAAAEEMTVVVTLGGAGRAIPKNHLHVEVNPARLNWFSGADNYAQVLAAAMDEASGRAFATEYAAPGGKVGTLGPAALPNPLALVKVQTAKDLALQFSEAGWQALAGSELAQHVGAHTTKPQGMTDAIWLTGLMNCAGEWTAGQTCYVANQGALAGVFPPEMANLPVDATGLAAELQKELVGPLDQARLALTAAPRVTRLVMRISPQEMDRDPVFAFHPGLPDVDNLHTATFRRVCPNGWAPATATRLTLPELGSWVFNGAPPNGGGPLGNNAKDPRFVNAPAALRIEVLDESGPPVVIDPKQADLAGAAIAGATPGKTSLPEGLVLKPASAWQPPPDNLPLSNQGPWQQPPGCQPKPGWTDGKPAPTQPPIPPMDGGPTESPDAGKPQPPKDAGSTAEMTTAPPVATPEPARDEGCTANRTSHGGLWSLLVMLCVMIVRKTRRLA